MHAATKRVGAHRSSPEDRISVLRTEVVSWLRVERVRLPDSLLEVSGC